jgi:hypothetical protein
MGLLDNLLNRNPTRDWRGQHGLALVLDLDQESFCGIRLGEPAERLEKFGPSADAQSARIGVFNYPDRGFEVSAEQGKFVEIEMAFGEGEGAHPYAGSVVRNGRSVTLTANTAEADLVALLGPAANRTEEAGDEDFPASVVLLWNLVRTDVEATLENGALAVFWVGTKT